MADTAAIAIACDLMARFARETGVTDAGGTVRRYLWTDAFAVCNFLELGRLTGEAGWQQLALGLVGQVHEVLGRHRSDDPRSGWISGLGGAEGRLHPTAGGLRIGKTLAERQPCEPFDERLEWDRDGQYFHYLTKWMHALVRVGATTGDPAYGRWAGELVKAAHKGFVGRTAAGGTRMVWKMSIDLTRALVASMGHHDPLDGLITAREVARFLARQPGAAPGLDLTGEIADFAALCKGRRWTTDDPLGVGGLLFDAGRVVEMMGDDDDFDGGDLLADLLGDAVAGLHAFANGGDLHERADFRLAFRELGLAIGVRAVARMQATIAGEAGRRTGDKARRLLDDLARHCPLAESIEGFWLRPASRQARSWRDHGDINAVMLATSLVPDGFLAIQPP